MDKAIEVGFSGPAAPALTSPFERDLTTLMPNLRIFSRALCGDRTLAEDMAQQALMKAWRAQASFKTGTNLKAWLFTILRNEFYSHTRRAWRETHWDADLGELIPAPANEQEWSIDLSDTTRALGQLPDTQREALLLISAGGYSFEDTARFFGTPLGTVKSRVTRARIGLSKILEGGKMPPRGVAGRGKTASDEILAQLSALKPAGTNAAAPRFRHQA